MSWKPQEWVLNTSALLQLTMLFCADFQHLGRLPASDDSNDSTPLVYKTGFLFVFGVPYILFSTLVP